jgi:plasmid replication initiation protein
MWESLELRIANRRFSAMPKTPWSEFISAHSTSYLVAARAPSAQRRTLRHRMHMLVKLLGQMKPAKAYAVTIDRQSGEQALHIAFEDEVDAKRFVEAVQAQPAPSADPACPRQWVFTMDDAKSDAIGAAMMTGGEIDER